MKKVTAVVLFVLLMCVTLYHVSGETKPKLPDTGVVVLGYHHLLRDEENKKFRDNPSVLSVAAFERQMSFLHEAGYHTATLPQLQEYVEGKIQLPHRTVVLTFDDGYRSNYRYAYPILKKYGYTATIFAIGDAIQDRNSGFHPDELDYISRDDMPKYADVFDIQSHTYAMHNKTLWLSNMIMKPKAAVLADLLKSKEMFHARYFAYPYGSYTAETVKMVKQAGYELAFTTKYGKVQPGDPPLMLKRILVHPGITDQQFKAIFSD